MPRSPASACLISATEVKGAEPVKWKKRLWPSKWRDQWIKPLFDISKTSPQRGCAFNQDPFEAPSSPRITAISGSTWCVKMWKYFQRISLTSWNLGPKPNFTSLGLPNHFFADPFRHILPDVEIGWRPTQVFAGQPHHLMPQDPGNVQNHHFHIEFHPLSWN